MQENIKKRQKHKVQPSPCFLDPVAFRPGPVNHRQSDRFAQYPPIQAPYADAFGEDRRPLSQPD